MKSFPIKTFVISAVFFIFVLFFILYLFFAILLGDLATAFEKILLDPAYASGLIGGGIVFGLVRSWLVYNRTKGNS